MLCFFFNIRRDLHDEWRDVEERDNLNLIKRVSMGASCNSEDDNNVSMVQSSKIRRDSELKR